MLVNFDCVIFYYCLVTNVFFFGGGGDNIFGEFFIFLEARFCLGLTDLHCEGRGKFLIDLL